MALVRKLVLHHEPMNEKHGIDEMAENTEGGR